MGAWDSPQIMSPKINDKEAIVMMYNIGMALEHIEIVD